VKRLAGLLLLALAIPAAAQETKRAKPPAHAKPTPQQIRKFNELEKKHDREIRGRSPNSTRPRPKTVRAPSPK
jgi:hypothetical protein